MAKDLENIHGMPESDEDEGWDGFEAQHEPAEEPVQEEEVDVEEKEVEAPEKEAETEAEEKPEATPSKAEEKPESEETKEEAPPETEQILRTVGEEAELKVKGKWYKISELPKEEIKNYLQKGLRFYQAMDELSGRERGLVEQESLLAERARYLDSIYQQRAGQSSGGLGQTTLPKELQITEYDSDEVRGLKTALVQMNEKLTTIEGSHQEQQLAQGRQVILSEIKQYEDEYPCAGLEEIIAVKALYPNIPIPKIMEASHRNRASVGHIERIFNNSPDIERHFSEKAVAKYLKARETREVNPSRPLKSSTPISSGKKQVPKDWDQAGDLARKALAEMENIAKEADLE